MIKPGIGEVLNMVEEFIVGGGDDKQAAGLQFRCRLCNEIAQGIFSPNGVCPECMKNFDIKYYLPAALQEKTFKNYMISEGVKRAYEKSAQFLKSDKSLYLYGGPGLGKTHLMAAALREQLENFQGIKYFNVARMLHILREDYETREEAEIRLVETIRQPNKKAGYSNFRMPSTTIIFLDDMCAEIVTKRTLELLYLIFNDAIENLKPRFFITSNKSVRFMSNNVSARIASRLVELCGLDNIVKVEGADFRVSYLKK